MNSDGEWWSSAECARHCGIAKSTWRDYVADGRAPTPAPGFDPYTGLRRWDADAVKAWHAGRPGQGARTDLTRSTISEED